MTVLLLVRHGETDWLGERLAGRLPDVHLNAEGRRKAETVAAMLRDVPLAEVYSSPLERAVETAEPAARTAGLRIVRDDRLQEVDFGGLAGFPYAELREVPIWRKVHRDPASVRYPGGESLQEVQDRAVRFIKELQSGRESGVVAAFTHADTIRLALAFFLGMPLASYHALVTDPASVSVLSLTGRVVRVHGVNLPPGSPLVIPKD
ncbi:MAG: histidine phosphatase family protein [Anaerolineales bacterium]|nr:histidine phosphatase family protein [Anaerolineales bacterium]